MEIFLSFHVGFFQICIEYKGKFLIQVRFWNLGKKWYGLEEIFGLISGNLPDDQGGFTYMN